MKIKQKVYSVVILERFIVETVSIDAHNPLVTTDKKLVDSTVEQLKEQYKLDGQDWEEYIYETGEGCSYSCIDKEGDGFTIFVNVFEMVI